MNAKTDTPKPWTPLPWRVDQNPYDHQFRVYGPDSPVVNAMFKATEIADAAYIVHAANSLPSLLAERDALKKALAGMVEWADATQMQRNFMAARVSFARATLNGKDA